MTRPSVSLATRPAVPSLPASIGELRRLFATLDPPSTGQLAGFYRADFIGPWCLRASGRPGVALLGLPRWQGKRFLNHEIATNIVGLLSEAREKLTMVVSPAASALDGRPCVALTYGAGAPLPWRWITDELRAFDDRHLLGMTRLGHPWLRRSALPFLLTRAG